jgi:isocitrate lyase
MMDTYQPNEYRAYSPEDVQKLKGSFNIEYTLAKLGAERLWQLFNEKPYVRALGCLTGNQAMQMVRAGLDALYISGWQTAADFGNMYPDQSLYPADKVPKVIRGINNALLRADQIEHAEGGAKRNWLVPMIADGEGGGGPLNTFELTKAMIESGVSGIHYEDQLSAMKKCGHLSEKVLVPTKTFIKNLIAAQLSIDICGTKTVLVARTDAESAAYITSDFDEYDAPFIDKSARTEEGFYKLVGDPMERCIARGLAYSNYADMLWMETSTPNLEQAEKFANAIHSKYPNKMLAYNNSPSFNWQKFLSDKEIAEFQDELGKMGYKFSFITLAAFHTNNFSMFKLASEYKDGAMSAYVKLQQEEFEWQIKGYTAIKHQHEIGTGYFDAVHKIINGNDNLSALKHSTEKHQF